MMGLLTFWHNDKAAERLMEAERQAMLLYACYRLGNLDDAEDVVQDVFVRLGGMGLVHEAARRKRGASPLPHLPCRTAARSRLSMWARSATTTVRSLTGH